MDQMVREAGHEVAINICNNTRNFQKDAKLEKAVWCTIMNISSTFVLSSQRISLSYFFFPLKIDLVIFHTELCISAGVDIQRSMFLEPEAWLVAS